jgi:hypothetical protein
VGVLGGCEHFGKLRVASCRRTRLPPPKPAASDTAKTQKLRPFIFASSPQPSEKAVFEQDITGEVARQQQPSLTRKAGQDSTL